ncbi:MAG: hypothetical protein HQL93_12910 [Magnetococcales bacterium]|nr:hypothetical protein [Magnetococcales bacterium]
MSVADSSRAKGCSATASGIGLHPKTDTGFYFSTERGFTVSVGVAKYTKMPELADADAVCIDKAILSKEGLDSEGAVCWV